MPKVFFVPGQTTIIDYAREIGPNMWAARCSWLMLPEIRVRHPGAVLDDQTAFLQAQESANGTKPARITEARFDLRSVMARCWTTSPMTPAIHSYCRPPRSAIWCACMPVVSVIAGRSCVCRSSPIARSVPGSAQRWPRIIDH